MVAAVPVGPVQVVTMPEEVVGHLRHPEVVVRPGMAVDLEIAVGVVEVDVGLAVVGLVVLALDLGLGFGVVPAAAWAWPDGQQPAQKVVVDLPWAVEAIHRADHEVEVE